MSPVHGTRVPVPDALRTQLAGVCPVITDTDALADASRDWWPLALVWTAEGVAQPVAELVARPLDAAQVADVLRACNDAAVPVTVAAGRSGVCGGSVPVHGGVVLDLTGLDGIVAVDRESLLLDVRAGTFGTPLEEQLRAEYGLTTGHFPQSIDISTVGGWLACRGAGQKSTRYGKIEDMVTGLDVVLADGRVVHTGGAPRAAVGPDLTQLFVGSEGTLGVVTGARLRLHPAPAAEIRGAWRPASVGAGLDAIRRVLQRGATPAVVRLYDGTEAERNFGLTGTPEVAPLLLVLDEGDGYVVDAVERVVHEEFAGFTRADDALVAQWWEHRNDVSALHTSIDAGLVVDTMEIAAPWAALDALYTDVCAALLAVDGVLMASAHLSHAYTDGACLYFTFAGIPDEASQRTREQCYTQAWDAAIGATLRGGAALSHHHGIGVNRARHVGAALGEGLAVLQAVKGALDPRGILNPGKLGLRDPFAASGAPTWP
ncbi:MAG: FAD-binding oxidoreductase [Acidimicrobiia bacterium]